MLMGTMANNGKGQGWGGEEAQKKRGEELG